MVHDGETEVVAGTVDTIAARPPRWPLAVAALAAALTLGAALAITSSDDEAMDLAAGLAGAAVPPSTAIDHSTHTLPDGSPWTPEGAAAAATTPTTTAVGQAPPPTCTDVALAAADPTACTTATTTIRDLSTTTTVPGQPAPTVPGTPLAPGGSGPGTTAPHQWVTTTTLAGPATTTTALRATTSTIAATSTTAAPTTTTTAGPAMSYVHGSVLKTDGSPWATSVQLHPTGSTSGAGGGATSAANGSFHVDVLVGSYHVYLPSAVSCDVSTAVVPVGGLQLTLRCQPK